VTSPKFAISAMKRLTSASLVSSIVLSGASQSTRPSARCVADHNAPTCVARALTLISSSSRSKCSSRVTSSTSTTSTSLSSWLEICRITASLPVVTSVRRDTLGSSVGATLKLSML
jgi:hypothetical protein